MHKKLISLITSGLLSLSILTGCRNEYVEYQEPQVQQKQVDEDLNELYLFFIKQDPKLKVCVDQIETYVKEKFEYTLEEYEKVYLMIHINKLVH